MATKTISLPEDVYEKLREERGEGESFGDVIDRLLRGRPLGDFHGVWDAETTTAARAAIAAGRDRSDDRLERLLDADASER
ncbi:MAG: antitoxin VapB family protein [archaeon]